MGSPGKLELSTRPTRKRQRRAHPQPTSHHQKQRRGEVFFVGPKRFFNSSDMREQIAAKVRGDEQQLIRTRATM